MRKQDIEYLKKYLDDDKLNIALRLLEQGIAPQYIIGNVDFYGNIIEVNPDVLIPRFETELLVEKTIHYIHDIFSKESLPNLKILDIGTGSGCISITLKKELGSYVTGIDISNEALDVAKKNALNNDVKINFVQSDIFSNIKDKFDVIISNPPYISLDEDIDEMVVNNEPHIALYAEDNGLYFYKIILEESSNYLNRKFLIAFEIGYEQGEAIKNLGKKYFRDVTIKVEKDYSGKDRFVFIYRN